MHSIYCTPNIGGVVRGGLHLPTPVSHIFFVAFALITEGALQQKSHLLFFFWELRGLSSPNFHIHVSVSDLYISRLGPYIWLQQNRLTDPGNI